MARTRSPANTNEIVRLYLSGLSALDVSRQVGCSKRTVFLRLKRAGIEPRPTTAGSYEVRGRKAARTRQGRALSPVETEAQAILRHFGVSLTLNFAVGKYNVDLADPVRKIGIELDASVFTRQRTRRAERVAFLHEQGWTIAYVCLAKRRHRLPHLLFDLVKRHWPDAALDLGHA